MSAGTLVKSNFINSVGQQIGSAKNGNRLMPVDSSVVLGMVTDLFSKIGIKDVENSKTEAINHPVIRSATKISFKGLSPLRISALLRVQGYEIYKPESSVVSRAYIFTGNLKCHEVYLLETIDGFLLAHDDKMIGYRKCR